MKNKKIMMILVLTIVSLTSLLLYANNLKASTKELFEADGYVLDSGIENEGSTNNQDYSQFYFKGNETYENKYPEQILFYDSDSKKVVVKNDNFIHYSNGNLAAFVSGVLVRSDDLGKEPVAYYRINTGAVLQKNGKGYQMNYLDKKITLDNFIWKLSDNKYILVSEKLTLEIGEGNTKTADDYIEVTYSDKGIISLQNQNVKYQTVGSDTKVTLSDGTLINFDNKNIIREDKTLLSLTNLIIDSDDNAEILPENNTTIDKDDKTKQNNENSSGNNGTGGTTDQPLAGGINGEGSGGTSGSDQNFELGDFNVPNLNDDNDNEDDNFESGSAKSIPTVTLTELKVSPMGVRAKGEISDPDDIISPNGMSLKIFEKATNKMVYESTVSQGDLSFDIAVEMLKPNTNYVLVANGSYVYNGIEYTNDMLNKPFTTDEIGISYYQVGITSSSLSYKINIENDAKISGARLVLYDQNKDVLGEEILLANEITDAIEDGGYIVHFNNLTSNTQYYVRMVDVIYDSNITITNYDDYQSVKSLKQSPLIEKPTVSVNKRNSSFIVYPGKSTDVDGGIEKYRYELIDAADTTKVVYATERDTLTNVEIAVDGSNVSRNQNYFLRIVAVFNDNTKTVEFASESSELFSLDSKELPTLGLAKDPTLHHDAINASILIEDIEKVILKGNVSTSRKARIRVVMTDPTNINVPLKNDGIMLVDEDPTLSEYNFPIDVVGLRANESYTFKVYADVNLGENSGNGVDESYNRLDYYIGEIVINTAPPVTVNMDIESDKTAPLTERFTVKSSLKNASADVAEKTKYQVGTLDSIDVKVFQGQVTNPETGTLMTQTKIKNTATGTNKTHNSSIRDVMYNDKALSIRASTFNSYAWNNYTGLYVTIYFTNAVDYVGNEIPLEDTIYTVRVNGILPEIANKNNSVQFSKFVNSEVGTSSDTSGGIFGTDKRTDLNNDTVVGYQYRAQIENTSRAIRKIEYEFYDVTNGAGTKVGSTITQNLTDTTASVPWLYIAVGDGLNDGVAGNDGRIIRRGRVYEIRWKAYLDLNFDGINETTLGTYSNSNNRWSLPKQAASMTTKTTLENDNLTIDYLLRDIDSYYLRNSQDLIDITLSNTSSSTPIAATISRSTNDNDWKQLRLSNIAAGTWKTSAMSGQFTGIYNTEDIGVQTIYPVHSIKDIVMSKADIHENQLNIRFEKTAGRTDDEFERAMRDVAGAQIILTKHGETTPEYTIDYKDIKVGGIYIPLEDIKNLVNEEFNVTTKLYYVNGNAYTNLDNVKKDGSSVYAIEIANNEFIDKVYPNYYYNAGGTAIVPQTNVELYPASGSIFAVTGTDNNLVLTSQINKQTANYTAQNTLFALNISQANNTLNVVFKELTKDELSSDGSLMKFETISGQLTMTNDAGTTSYIGGIDSVVLNYSFDMSNATQSQDSKLYFELHELQQDGSYSIIRETDTFAYTADDYGKNLQMTISDLSLDQSYRVKVYIKDRAGNKIYMFDKISERIGRTYPFKTSKNVEVIVQSSSTTSSKNGTIIDRNGIFEFNISQTGFSKIRYEIFEWDETVSDYASIPLRTEEDVNESQFSSSMTKSFKIGRGADEIKLAKQYKLKITILSNKLPYGEQRETEVGFTEYNFKFLTLRNPIVNMKLLPSLDGNNHKITATVNVSDLDFVSTTSKYKIKIFDKSGNDVTPEMIQKTEYNFSVQNQQIIFDQNILPSSEYQIQFITEIDANNDGQVNDYVLTSKVTTLNDYGVSIGEIETIRNDSDRNKVDLVFINSINLNRVKNIRYTIYSTDTGTTISNESVFTLVTSGSGNNIYLYHTISGQDGVTGTNIFSSSGRYLIEIQFLDTDNNLVGTQSLTYVYR